MSWKAPDLSGKTAVVAGATRGAGRGIAVALGECGATVVCTGRSTDADGPSPMGRKETIDETARMVTEAGGKGIARRVDHLDTAQVRALADSLDKVHILVNDIWGSDGTVAWGKPFWEQDPDEAWSVVQTAMRTHLTTAALLAPKLEASKGLLVEITDGDNVQYRGNVVYDLVKTGIMRMAHGFSHDLKDATAVAVTPGFLRSEAVLDFLGVSAEGWRDGIEQDEHFAFSETPRYVGRGIASLAADPDKDRFHGETLASWTLADLYGVEDVDGARPHWGEHARTTFPAWRPLDDAYYAYLQPFM